jgi:hypothetical protein
MFNPDIPPTNPTPWDDEFDGSVLNPKWTIWNQQVGQTISISNGAVTMYTPPTIQARVFSIIQPAPSGNWLVRAKFSFNCATWDYLGWGMIARRITGNDRATQCCSMYNSTFGVQTIYSQNDAGVTYNNNDIDLYNHESTIYYMEMEYDGTNYTWRLSHTGAYYARCYQYPSASWTGTPEWIGLNVHAWCNTNNVNWGGTVSCDWFRRIV